MHACQCTLSHPKFALMLAAGLLGITKFTLIERLQYMCQMILRPHLVFIPETVLYSYQSLKL